MDATEPSRRWWQSHEWNVLLVIALIAMLPLGWLGWQASIVRHRRALRVGMNCSVSGTFDGELIRDRCPDRRIPTIRRLLGDQGVYFIMFDEPLTSSDRELIKEFPEAYVFLRRSPWPTRIGL